MKAIEISARKGVHSHKLCPDIVSSVIRASEGLRSGFRDVISFVLERPGDSVKRQMVFRFKSQMFFPGVDTGAVLKIVLDGLMENGYGLRALRLFSAEHAVRRGIFESYKGYEYSIYINGPDAVPDFDREKCLGRLGLEMSDTQVLGGGQFAEQYGIPPEHLGDMWQKAVKKEAVVKLAPKLLAAALDPGTGPVAVLNAQMANSRLRVEREGGVLLAAVVESLGEDSSSWARMRGRFLGSSEPGQARKGSLRQVLADQHDSYHLVDDHNNYNGVHLSSCVLESVLEMDLWFFMAPEELKTGRYLIERGILRPDLDWLMFNPVANFAGNRKSVFTHTDCLDAKQAVPVLIEILEDRG